MHSNPPIPRPGKPSKPGKASSGKVRLVVIGAVAGIVVLFAAVLMSAPGGSKSDPASVVRSQIKNLKLKQARQAEQRQAPQTPRGEILSG